MFDSYFSWWFLLLLGVWIAGLVIWQQPKASAEFRWGAGVLVLAYIAMLFMALRVDRTISATSTDSEPLLVAVDGLPILLALLSVVSAMMMIAPLSWSGERFWFASFTLGNAGLVWKSGLVNPTIMLTIMAALILMSLAREAALSRTWTWTDLLPRSEERTGGLQQIRTPVLAVTGMLLAVLFVGTVSHALRIERGRAFASHRFSAIPSTELVQSALGTATKSEDESNSMNQRSESGWRADVLLLASVLGFLVFAMVGTGQLTMHSARSPVSEKD